MPRNRSVRVATLGSAAQRPAAPAPGIKTRVSGPLARRVVVAALVVVSLALLSVYVREKDDGQGTLHGLQSAGAAVLRPFEVAADRVAQPFQDASDWFGGVLGAKSENAKLHREIDALRRQVIENETAARENADLKALLHYRDSLRFPKDFRAIAARILGRPAAQFVQQVVVAAGSNYGVRLHAPVVTADGLVGQVTTVARTTALVTLLTDQTAAASGLDVKSKATGIVRHRSTDDTLFMDRVTKDQVMNRGDLVVTAGWRHGGLSDIYPKGIPIGIVTYVGQVDTDLFKKVLIEPFVHLGSVESVLILDHLVGAG